jgi:hypothetical protein
MTDQGSKSSRPTMWCKQCGYALNGLSENRCPECGREFDPNDSSTFSIASTPGRCPACQSQSPLGLLVRPPLECRRCGTKIEPHMPPAGEFRRLTIIGISCWVLCALLGTCFFPDSFVRSLATSYWAIVLLVFMLMGLTTLIAVATIVPFYAKRTRYSIRKNGDKSGSRGHEHGG